MYRSRARAWATNKLAHGSALALVIAGVVAACGPFVDDLVPPIVPISCGNSECSPAQVCCGSSMTHSLTCEEAATDPRCDLLLACSRPADCSRPDSILGSASPCCLSIPVFGAATSFCAYLSTTCAYALCARDSDCPGGWSCVEGIVRGIPVFVCQAATTQDAATIESGLEDGPLVDSSEEAATDGELPDAGSSDADSSDAGSSDAGSSDAGSSDAPTDGGADGSD